MNFDIARQPIIPAFVTLLLVAGVANVAPTAAPEAVAPLSQLDGWLLDFEQSAPVWSRVMSFVLLLWTGLLMGRITVRYGLYATNSCVAIPLFGIAAACAWPAAGLVGAVTLLLLALSTHNFCRSFRNGYAFDNIFRAGLYLGLVPLVYLPAAPLMLLLPAAVVLLKRTLRELTVTLAGMLLPLLTACYLNWATGAPFDAPLQQAVELFTHNDGMHLWNLPWPALLLPGALLLLDIASLAAYLNSVYSVGFKARGILALAGCMLLLTVAVALLPCATSVALLLCALPTALLAPSCSYGCTTPSRWPSTRCCSSGRLQPPTSGRSSPPHSGNEALATAHPLRSGKNLHRTAAKDCSAPKRLANIAAKVHSR